MISSYNPTFVLDLGMQLFKDLTTVV